MSTPPIGLPGRVYAQVLMQTSGTGTGTLSARYIPSHLPDRVVERRNCKYGFVAKDVSCSTSDGGGWE